MACKAMVRYLASAANSVQASRKGKQTSNGDTILYGHGYGAVALRSLMIRREWPSFIDRKALSVQLHRRQGRRPVPSAAVRRQGVRRVLLVAVRCCT